jgi:hypothetical protein
MQLPRRQQANLQIYRRNTVIRWPKAPRHALVGAGLAVAYLCYGQAIPWLEHQRVIVESRANVVAQAAALSHYKALTDTINLAISDGLARDQSLARIRVAFMQKIATQTNIPTLKWDVTNAITRTGHIVGTMRTDLPVADWTDYFEAMLAHRCTNVNIETMVSEATLGRVKEMKLRGFVVCPIVTTRGELIGAVFGSWDIGDPDPPDMAATEAVIHAVAVKIGAAVT